MNPHDIEASLGGAEPPAGLHPLVQALWHDARGDWERAHRIVQAQEGPAAAAVHAYLHRKEGDLDNADYWYARAGKMRPNTDLETEWRELVGVAPSPVRNPPEAGG